jgi:hypothetical protein
MSTTSKEMLELGRMEAVQRLQTFARQMEEGKVLLGDKAYKIPERVHLEIKGENEELEIGLKWKAFSK